MATYISITTDTPPNYLSDESDTAQDAPTQDAPTQDAALAAAWQADAWRGLALTGIQFGHVGLSVSHVHTNDLPKVLADLRTLARILDAIAGPAPTTD